MATYAYIAKNRAGEEVVGQAVAATIDDVVSQLHSEGLSVLHVAPNKSGRSLKEHWARFANKTFGSASTQDKAVFSRQLATVLESGIPLVKGLKGLAAESGRNLVIKTVPDLALRLERGESLSEAMSKHPQAFDRLYLSMIRAGEQSGALDRIVNQLANYLEKIDAIKQKVKAAMAYPTFILGFTVLATLFMIIKIVPTFANVYEELGQQLPFLTRVVIGVSNAVRNNGLLSLFFFVSTVLAFYLAVRTPTGRRLWDNFVLRVPVFGPILTKSVMSRFARTFGILTSTGLPVIESLELCRGAVGNVVISDAIGSAKLSIAKGFGVTESFRATRAFPEMLLQLMQTGEETGELDTLMLRTADFYDRQVETTVDGISSLIEPILILIVGTVIGFIVVSMFLPIFELGDAMLKGNM